MDFTFRGVSALQRDCASQKEQFTVFAQRSRLVTCQRWLTLHARQSYILAAQSIVCHVYVINHTRIGFVFAPIVTGGHSTRFVVFFPFPELNHLQ